MLISLGIIALVVAMLVVRYNAFNSEVLLQSQAYEIGLDIREAQVFTVSALGEVGQFREEYGLYFDMITPDRYVLFVDSPVYSGGSATVYYDEGEELGAPYFLDTRYQIDGLCINNCSQAVDDLTVYFNRPDFDANFTSRSYSGSIGDVEIIVAPVVGAGTETRRVLVNATGQISIE
jgi:hypothetical protein